MYLPYTPGSYRSPGGRGYAIFSATIARLAAVTGLTSFGREKGQEALYSYVQTKNTTTKYASRRQDKN